MSSIDGKIEEERKKFDEVRSAGEELAQALKPHRENMASVRGWRLNIRRNLERLQQPQKKRLTQDAFTNLEKAQERYNSAIQQLNGVLRRDVDIDLKLAQIENYHTELDKLQSTAGFETQKTWENEIGEINREVAQITSKVADFRNHLKRAESSENEEDKRKEAVAKVNAELDDLAIFASLIDDTQSKTISVVFNDDIKHVYDNYKNSLNADIETFLEDGEEDEQEFIFSAVQRNFTDPLTGLRELVLNNVYFPANPAGKQIGTLDTDEPYQELVKSVQNRLEQIQSVSYRVRPELEPVIIDVRAYLSAPKRQVEVLSEIPQNVSERLLELTHGRYEITVKASDEINAYASKYGTLPIEIANNSRQVNDAVTELNEKVLELADIAGTFTSKRNSAQGRHVVNSLKTSMHKLSRATNKQYLAFTNALADFDESVTQVESWFDEKWYQFGGQPENHKNAGAGDESKSTYTGIPKSKANLKNF